MYVVEEVDKEHFEMKEKINMQSREDLCVPIVIDERQSVLSARVAEECNRVLGQELAEVEE